MFHNLPSLSAAFSLFLITLWMMTTPRDMPQAGGEVWERTPPLLCSQPPVRQVTKEAMC